MTKETKLKTFPIIKTATNIRFAAMLADSITISSKSLFSLVPTDKILLSVFCNFS
jgi:hypothetical protein